MNLATVFYIIGFILASVLTARPAAAAPAEAYFKYGPGVFLQDPRSKVEVKNFALGYRGHLVGNLSHQTELGVVADVRQDIGRRTFGYAAWGVGVVTATRPVFASGFWSVSGISHTDSRLGGHFQFHNDLQVGMRDRTGNAISLGYKHISSAGLSLPNKGRDFITATITLGI